MNVLMNYDYPGNVRELKSIVKSAVNLAQGNSINLNCLPAHVRQKAKSATPISAPSERSVPTLAELEQAHIIKVYRMKNKNKAESARVLGIGINTLRRKLKAYGLK